MDPVIAYLLIRNIEKEKEIKNKQNKQNNIHLVHREKIRNIVKISCPRCGQNTYWCHCSEKKKEKEK